MPASRHPKSPTEVRGPVLGLPHLLQLRRNPIEHNDFLREAYGEVFRLNVFGTTLLRHLRARTPPSRCWSTATAIFANGPAWSHFIGPFFRRGLMLLDFDEHLHHRRILQHAFTNDALRRYHAVMVPHIRRGLAAWGEWRTRGCTTCSRRSPSTWPWRPSSAST